MLSLVDIRKSYVTGPVTAEILRGVRLEVKRDDLLSIMGPSGCGESALMNIIGLLDQPTGGSYFLDGREISAMRDNELSVIRNASIGFVFQSFYLLPRLTAWENVAVPLIYRGMSGPAVRRRAIDMLERVDMGERAGYRPNALSGGEQQRVAIARALVGEPASVLADEPTGTPDPATGKEIRKSCRCLSTSTPRSSAPSSLSPMTEKSRGNAPGSRTSPTVSAQEEKPPDMWPARRPGRACGPLSQEQPQGGGQQPVRLHPAQPARADRYCLGRLDPDR